MFARISGRKQAREQPFQRRGSSAVTERHIWRTFFGSPGPVLAVCFTSMWMNLLLLVPPLFMMQVYDRVLTSRSSTTLWLMMGAALGLIVAFAILDDLRNRLLIRVGVRIDADLHERVFEAIFWQNLRRPEASRARVLQEIQTVRNFVSGQALVAFFDLPWTPLYILICWAVDPILALIAVIAAAVSLSLTVLMEFATRPSLDTATRHSMAANTIADASLRNSEVIEAMGMLSSLMRRWTAGYRQAIVHQSRASDRAAIFNALAKGVQQASYIVTLGIGAVLVIDDRITPGLMIITSMVVARALMPINQLVASWKSFVAARGAAKRLASLLEERGRRLVEKMALPPPEGNILVDRVVVARGPGVPPILKGVHFDVPAGMQVGVIGPSGSGKTTLARAILGLVPLVQGVVRLDGADVAMLNRERLGPYIGYLPQDVELFDGSIAENIARFGPINSDAVVDAAKVAGVHDLVLSLSAGYDTRIGEQGAVLSAGQRQRVALARAVYGNPRLIVLDEPNSNLDTDGEQALHRALLLLRERRATVIVIAHRSSILGNLDRIVVLRDGAMETYEATAELMPKLMRPVAGQRQS